MSAIHETEAWFMGVGFVPDDPAADVRRTAIQIGLQLEQLGRKLSTVGLGAGVGDFLIQYGIMFKSGECDRAVRQALQNPTCREQLLKGDLNLIWQTVGACRALGAEVGDAYKAEVEARWKLEQPDGTFHVDNTGEVDPPRDWVAPKYKDFLC